jgi:hypothetical protein
MNFEGIFFASYEDETRRLSKNKERVPVQRNSTYKYIYESE